MFLKRFFIGNSVHYRKYCISNALHINKSLLRENYSGILAKLHKCNFNTFFEKKITCLNASNALPLHRKCYSRGLLDGDVSMLQKNHEKDLRDITEIFPHPRNTLHELSTRVREKVFDIQFTENVTQGTKSSVHQRDWTCTYNFEWPEKINFQSTAPTKRQAAERTAAKALNYLYSNKWISDKGSPLYKSEDIQINTETSMEKPEIFDCESDIKLKIKELFPDPRVTLYEFANRTPDKIFDIYYSQDTVAPKGGRKKALHNDWTCTYSFVWPENVKFSGSAKSKRHAAEKSATQALQYLYTNKRINDRGHPVYDKGVIEEIRSNLNQPVHINISEASMERIDRVWSDYEEIKDIYESTFRAAKRNMIRMPAVLTKDSTIDDEDGFSEDDGHLESEVSDLSELKVPIHPVYGRPLTAPSVATLQKRDRMLRLKFERYDEELTALPIDQYANEITSTLEKHRVAVIVGAAGCGKSTRVPAAVLRHVGAATAAIVSEPRRVAAIGLAERVASEMGEEVGDSIGYQVRLHAKPPRPPAGSVLYCTSGVLLRRLQLNPGLDGCSHVFIDEAHERDVNTDVTLLLLKKALELNPRLKVIVMSATLDTSVFTRYFDACPVIEVPGRTFPVQLSHLDDVQQKFGIRLSKTMESCHKNHLKPFVNCQEIVEVIKAVDRTEPEGAILVFLPGWAEIKKAKLLLEQHYGESGIHLILPVHSRLSTADQTKMFAKPSPGIRKIVLATNIAETSITIPDVVYVIDSGAHKENRITDTGTSSLETVWVSLAGAKQRTGRAGRVQPGHCYRMYTMDKEAEFAPHTTPEILRIPLEQTALDCKTYAPEDKIENFLLQLPEPPTKKAIQMAVNDLIDLGALTRSEQLTRLGVLVSRMSLHPRLACSILHSAVVGGVVAGASVATHCGDNVEVFTDAADRREEIREIKRKYSATSDHAALHWILEEFERTFAEARWSGVNEWCSRLGLRKDRLGYVKSLSNLHLEQLLSSGIVESTAEVDELNRFSGIDELTAAVLLSGSNALLKTRKRVRTKGKLSTAVELYTSSGDRAHIGSDSVNYGITKKGPHHLLTYFGGLHSAERRALVVYKTSLVPPHTALLFCRGELEKRDVSDNETALILPRHKLEVRMTTSQGEQIIKAREMLWKTLQYYIERDIKNLDYDENTRISRFKVRLIKAIGRILVEGNRELLGKHVMDISMDDEEN